MNRMTKLGMLAAAWFLGCIAMPVLAQNPPPPPPDGGQPPPGDNAGPGRGGRNRQQFDPAQMRQRMMERMQEALGATDEEIKALQPKIEHVMQVQRDVGGRGMFGFGRGGPGGGFGGPGGGPGGRPDRNPNPDQPPSPVQENMRDLQNTLENKDASPDEIKAKLTELRDARTKAKEELVTAQKDLRELLTQRQEAVMVTMGVLE